MYQIILASASPRRKDILNQIGTEFTVVTSELEEVMTKEAPPILVRRLSAGKAEEVLTRIHFGQEKKKESISGHLYTVNTDAIIIGADTVVAFDGHILGKPKTKEDAEQMLELLSGKVHQVYTGVCLLIVEAGNVIEEISFAEQTDVHMYPTTRAERLAYIATGEPMDKAGAYAVQGRFAPYIAEMKGDYYNVVGLPVARIFQELKSHGLDLRTGEKIEYFFD